MEIVAASNDPVRLAFLVLLLRDAGLDPVEYDQHMAAMQGSIGAIQRRIAVPAAQAGAARLVLRQAGDL
jgi:hypothetical protein